MKLNQDYIKFLIQLMQQQERERERGELENYIDT
jgi:hypothetical protein